MVRPRLDRYVCVSSKVHCYQNMSDEHYKGGKMAKNIPMHNIPAEKSTFLDKFATMAR